MLLDVKLTQGDYWKGSQIPHWLYMAFTIFPLTGLLGIDHLLLRSPWTGLLKFLTMIPLLGFWYFYDIAQATGEHDLLEKYGISLPFYGPTGIGAGMFIGKDTPLSPPDTARPWRYIAYVFSTMLFLATPVNKFVLGDFAGGFAQILMYILFPLTFMAIIWGFYDIYRIFFKQEELFEKGPARMLPASWLIGEYSDRSTLGPLPALTKDEIPSSTFWPIRLASAVGEVPIAVAGLVAKEGVSEAKDIMHSGTAVIKESIDAADTIVKSTVQPIAEATEKAGDAAVKMADLAAKLPGIAEKITVGLADPDVIAKKIAESAKASVPQVPQVPQVPSIPAAAAAMTGGALSRSLFNNSEPSISSSVLIFSVALLAFSGYVIYMTRKTLYTTTEDDDSPPYPTSVRRTSQPGVKGK